MTEENRSEEKTETSGDGVFRAMVAVTRELAAKGIGKDSKNTEQKWTYRGIDAVCDAVGPLLAKNGLTLVCKYTDRETVERKTQRGYAAFWVTVAGTFTFFAEDGTCVECGPFYGEAMDTGDKAGGKAESYAYRNALIKTFCIPVNGADEDTDATTPEPVEPSAKPQKTTKKPSKKPEAKPPEPDPTIAQKRTELLRKVLDGVGGNQRESAARLIHSITGKDFADLDESDRLLLDAKFQEAINKGTRAELLKGAGLEPGDA